jgi:hypothetical protein
MSKGDFYNKEALLLDVARESRDLGVAQGDRIRALFSLAGKGQKDLIAAYSVDKADASKVISGKRNTSTIQDFIVEFLDLPGTLLFDNFKGKEIAEKDCSSW